MSEIISEFSLRASSEGNDAPSRVLFVPEIIYHVMSFLTRPDNSRSARVCKLWLDIALRNVWREVDDMYAVFLALGPFVELQNESGVRLYAFSEQPGVKNWRRFNKYAAYIQKFVYAPTVEATSQKLLSHEVMAQISLTRTRLNILPNLNTLVWRPHSSAANSSTGSPTLNDGLLFMHSAVTNFTFSHLNATAEPYANYFLGDIAPRMPHLTHLNFHSSEAVAKVESGICDLVKGLHGVTTIRLPAYYLTTPVAEALSVLPCLRVLVIGHGRPEDTYPIQPNLEFRPVLLPSSFKSLKNRALNMHVADARKVISTIPSSPGLGLLFVMFRTTNPPLDIRKLLEACAQTQRTIRYLTLIPDRSSIRRDLTEGDRGSLEFPHLMLLMQLTMLNQLTIDHPSPLFLSVADVTSIVNSLPLLQSLRLNPEPVYPQTSPLGLDVLAVVARNCPLLVNLGLFVDATLPTESIPHDLTFQRLTSLALGPSVINKEACHPIALYLSALLPGKCRISYKAWWIDVARQHTHPSAQIATERFKLWEEVDGLLQLLEKASARFRDQQSMTLDE